MTNNQFCTNCGAQVSEQAVACMACGAVPFGQRKFCRHCGSELNPEQVICTKCGSGIGGGTGTTAAPSTSQASFCTNCGNSVSKQAVACMSCGAEPAKYRKHCYGCGVALNSEQVVCVRCGVPVGNIAINTWSQTSSNSKLLNTYFMVFWICTVVGYPLLFVLIGVPVIATGFVFAFMLLYQCWKLIPVDIARTTPGKAVGYCFIPFFNFYWIFVAFKGLGEDMNETLRQRGIQFEVNSGLGLNYCLSVIGTPIFSTLFLYGTFLNEIGVDGTVLAVVGAVGYAVCSIAALVFCIFFLKSVKDGAVALLERRDA